MISILDAIRHTKEKFIFDGDELNLVSTMVINITMNPNYVGRKPLPDNLKALFRTVAMVLPDYNLIAEIFLYSVGFLDARILSKKIVISLRLASEQLSTQFHYDWGMRSLKTILQAAGHIKRVSKLDEAVIIFNVLESVNIPKFVFSDIAVF